MNPTLKTVLLTVLTLSVFAIALVELSGVSRTALINRFGGKEAHSHEASPEDQARRDEEIKNKPKTILVVDTTKHNFGNINEGDKVRHTWLVKNGGNEPLFIANVQTSCGCTAPFFSKDPILPGQSGEVTLEFNSTGKPGHVQKNALIIANAENAPFSIGFTADVEPTK